MKNLKYLLVLLFTFCLAGCFELNEEININEDGTGTYTSKMDMSKLLEIIQNFGGEDALTKDGLDKPMDTTILMKGVMDKIKDTSVPKEVWKNGKMSIKFNASDKIFKTNIFVPFKNQGNLQQLMSGTGNGTGMSEVFKNLFGRQDTAGREQPVDSPRDPDINQVSTVFDVTVKNGLISKKINQEKYKALMQRPDIQQAKQMASQGMEILYTTIFRLPRPAKRIDNVLLLVSNDKKTITGRFNILDLFNNPDKFSYTIEY